MALTVWMNGSFVVPDEANVSIFDAGMQHAVGLFETMLARNGRVFRPRAHMTRLAGSASELMLTERLRADALAEACDLVAARSELGSARIRLTITGGDLSGLQAEGRSQQDPTVMIVAQPSTEYPPEFFERGVMVTVADVKANPLSMHAGHKTMNYWERIQCLQIAGSRGGSESLWFSATNHLASGCVSNIFAVRDGSLITPIARGEEAAGSLRAPVLPGVTRAAIIELAEAAGLNVEKRMMDIDDVMRAEELFLTNSGWGVLPVVAVEATSIGGGKVGEVAAAMRAAWLDLVETETRGEG
ncbi:MAG: aminotransferase class IV [Phycisphaerales bacterium]